MKSAIVVATTVAVLCPHCSAEQPDPEAGSDKWTPEQLRAAIGDVRTCVSCDATFRIRHTKPTTLAES